MRLPALVSILAALAAGCAVDPLSDARISSTCASYCAQANQCDDETDVAQCEADCEDVVAGCDDDTSRERALDDADACAQESCDDFAACTFGAVVQCEVGI